MKKINPYKVFVCLLVLYMFFTLTYTIWKTGILNKIIGFLIFLNIIWFYCKHLTRKKIIILFCTLFPVMWAIFKSIDAFSHISDGICFLITIFLLTELSNDSFINRIYINLEQSQKFIRNIVMVCNCILCISFFDYKCYDFSQWDGSYYIGYTNTAHTLASGSCLLLIFSLYMIKNKKSIKSFIFLVPSSIAILKSGARTFLVPVVIAYLLFYFYQIRKKIFKILIPPIAIIGAIYIFFNSAMATKFAFTVNNKYVNTNFMGRFTNGRTDFWRIDLLTFIYEYDFFQKMLGNGLDYIYMLNKIKIGLAIWAHNDIINSLLTIGIIATVTYIYVIFFLCRDIMKKDKNILISSLIILYIIGPALLNGFYTYQHYVYSFFILIILYKKYYIKNKNFNKLIINMEDK